MSFQLCEKCKGLWTYFGTGAKPNVCPKCELDAKKESNTMQQEVMQPRQLMN